MTKKSAKKSQGKSRVGGNVNRKPAAVSDKKKVVSSPVLPNVTSEKSAERNNDILVIRVPTDWLHFLGMKAVEVEHDRAKMDGGKLKRNVGAATMARSILADWIAAHQKKSTVKK